MGCFGSVDKSEMSERKLVFNKNNEFILYDIPELSKYDPPITLSFVRSYDDNSEGLISNLPGETYENNRWTELYEQVLGIQVKYDWIVPRELYQQRLNAQITAGQIPDVVKVDVQQLRQLTHAGLIHDLTEVYEQYATPFTKEILAQEVSNPFELATIGGRLMGIPDTNPSIERAEFLWIRTDWLNNLQLKPPQSIEDVLAIAKAFTEDDPDRNGIDDTYGLALSNLLWDPVMGLTGFMAGFNAYPSIWITDQEGKLVYGGVQPEVKDALLALQKMYAEGQIDEEFMFKDGIKAATLVAEGKVGMLYGEQWASFFPIQPSADERPEVTWQAFPIVADVGQLARVPLKFSTNHFFAVSKRVEHPEAVVKMINLHLEKNWGETADYSFYYSNPFPVWQLSPVTPFPAKKNLEAYRQLAEARRTGDMSRLNDEARAIHDNITRFLEEEDYLGWGWERTYGPDGAFAILDRYENNNQLLYESFFGAASETMIAKQSILREMQNETYLNIILGRPIELFDDFVNDWYRLGGDQVIEEVNEWYAERGNQ